MNSNIFENYRITFSMNSSATLIALNQIVVVIRKAGRMHACHEICTLSFYLKVSSKKVAKLNFARLLLICQRRLLWSMLTTSQLGDYLSNATQSLVISSVLLAIYFAPLDCSLHSIIIHFSSVCCLQTASSSLFPLIFRFHSKFSL